MASTAFIGDIALALELIAFGMGLYLLMVFAEKKESLCCYRWFKGGAYFIIISSLLAFSCTISHIYSISKNAHKINPMGMGMPSMNSPMQMPMQMPMPMNPQGSQSPYPQSQMMPPPMMQNQATPSQPQNQMPSPMQTPQP